MHGLVTLRDWFSRGTLATETKSASMGYRHMSINVGLLGNMNNNNFAFLRHLIDIGVDAKLFLMACDGLGPLRHFAPECDTWNIERWQPYIERINAPNRYVSALGNGFPWNIIFWSKHLFEIVRGRPEALTRPPSLSQLSAQLAPYDRLVGSGITPSLMKSINRDLQIFYPYSSGVEWVGDPGTLAALNQKSWIRRQGALSVRDRQIEGIRNAKHVVTGDVGYTASQFDAIGVKSSVLQLPILYRETSPRILPAHLQEIIRHISQYELRFISHVRHHWVNTGEFDLQTWESSYSKHNDWTIHAYADFRKNHPTIRTVLVLTEYGNDVSATKRLCDALGVSRDILWLPQMPRIELLEVISACDVGIGEFYSAPRMLWGGTALEIMAMGRPLVQGFIFAEDDYKGLYGHPPPPLLAVRNKDDVARWLELLGTTASLRERLGNESRHWFDKHYGVGLARRYIDLLKT